MNKIVSSLMDHLEHKPIYVENERGEVLLSFADVYHLQNFVAEVRKHGVVYGLELAKMTKEAPPMAPVSVVRHMSRGTNWPSVEEARKALEKHAPSMQQVFREEHLCDPLRGQTQDPLTGRWKRGKE